MYYVYILANNFNTTIYVGMTNDLIRRVYEHKNHLDKQSFTSRYNVTKLVYYDSVNEAKDAIAREKQLKSWSRKRKDALIQEFNPQWRELYDDLLG